MEAIDRPTWNPTRRCTATNRAGSRCLRQPIPGGEVCVMHGGRAPQVQKSARARLLDGADLAIDYLLNLLTPRPPCEVCGRSDADRDPTVVRACQLVLDRSGFHPTLTVEQVAAPRNEYEDLTDDQLTERLEALLKQCYQMRDFNRQQEQPRLGEGVIDAIVIDDGFLVPEDDTTHEAAIDDAAGVLTSEPAPQADDPNPSGIATPEKWTTDDEVAK